MPQIHRRDFTADAESNITITEVHGALGPMTTQEVVYIRDHLLKTQGIGGPDATLEKFTTYLSHVINESLTPGR